MTEEQKAELTKAAEILFEYTQPDSGIDSGNLFYAAVVYQREAEKLREENERLKKALKAIALTEDGQLRVLGVSRSGAVAGFERHLRIAREALKGVSVPK